MPRKYASQPSTGTLPPTPDDQDAYAPHLGQKDRAIYEAASAGADLSEEIRLLRTLVTRLAEDGKLENNPIQIRQALIALWRLIQIQSSNNADEPELQAALRDAAEAVLAGSERTSGDEAT